MRNIIGIDECGLGPIAGPLYVAAVVFPEDLVIEGVRDSKKVSPRKRMKLVPEIDKQSLFWVMAVSFPDTIDQYGIRKCNIACASYCAHAARQKFPNALTIIDGQDLVDGVPPNEQRAIVGADDKYQAVSAASIMAKVHRDDYMIEIGLKYPDYLFEKHKGYPTKIHKDALTAHGICPEHRKSYGPVKQVLQSMS